MSRHEIEQHRITHKIGSEKTQVLCDSTQLLPDASVIKAEFVQCMEDGRIVGSGRTYSTTLPPESFVRELLDADLATSNGVVRLLGILGLDLAEPLELAGLGLIDQMMTVAAEPGHIGPFIVEGCYLSPRMLIAIGSHGPGSKMVEGVFRPADDAYEIGTQISCGHWEQIARRLRLVRAAVNHFVAYHEHTDVMKAWTSEGFEARVEHQFTKFDMPHPPDVTHVVESSEADAWRLFVAVHAQLLRDHIPNLTAWLAHGSASLRIAALPSSIATALMVQLHNLIVDGITIRRCANETCGRPFARQRGRARKGQHRTSGVIYCDAACGKAQMQREYRRRNRRRTATEAENPRAAVGGTPQPADAMPSGAGGRP
jgi:hypothetical protein